MAQCNESRRQFVKRAVYVTPAVLSLAAAPEYAKAGSVKDPGKKPPKDKPSKPDKVPKGKRWA